MTTASLMAKKKRAYRRRSTKISLTGLAETWILTSAGLNATVGTGLAGFLSGQTRHAGTGRLGYNPGGDGYSVASLWELAGFTKSGWSMDAVGGNYGSKTFGDMVKTNLARNGPRSLATIILTPIAFRFGKKIMRKPVTFINKGLKGTGLRV